MEVTYRVRGMDGRQYGPGNLIQLQSWVNEGRVSPQTAISRSDTGHWRPAAQLRELAWPGAVREAAHAIRPDSAPVAHAILTRKIHGGAAWFFWIAGITVLNTILIHAGSDTVFVLGLGLMQLFDAVGTELGGVGPLVALAFDTVAVGLLVLLGFFARKRRPWAFLTGAMLYSLDSLLLLLAGDWMGLGIHVVALFFIIQGLRAHRELVALEHSLAPALAAAGDPTGSNGNLEYAGAQ